MKNIILFVFCFCITALLFATPIHVKATGLKTTDDLIVLQGSPTRMHLAIEAPFVVANQYDLLACTTTTPQTCQFLDLSWRDWIGKPGWQITNNSLNLTANNYEYKMTPQLYFAQQDYRNILFLHSGSSFVWSVE